MGLRRAAGFALILLLAVAAPPRLAFPVVALLFVAAGMWVLQTRHPVPVWERVLSLGAIAAVAWFALDVKEPPSAGFLGDQDVAAIARGVDVRPDRGLAVAVGIDFEGCGQPVEVTMVVGGTAEFFADNRHRLTRPVRVQVAIPDDELDPVDGDEMPVLRPGESEDDLPIPFGAQGAPDPARFKPARTTRVDGRTILQGDVYRWRDHLSPLVTKFRADWLHQRDRLGTTCYLKPPALTGAGTAYVGADLAGMAVPGAVPVELALYDSERDVNIPYRANLTLTTGTLQVHARNGSVRDELSRPAPNETLGGDAAYSCPNEPATTAAVGDRRAGAADQLRRDRRTRLAGPSGVYSSDLIASPSHDCSGQLVMAGAEADFSRDFVLILLGALVSLAAEAYFRASEPRGGAVSRS